MELRSSQREEEEKYIPEKARGSSYSQHCQQREDAMLQPFNVDRGQGCC